MTRAIVCTVVLFAVPAVPGRLPAGLTETSVVAIVPARYHSSRLPGKPLAEIARSSRWSSTSTGAPPRAAVDAVIVATDDQRIVDAVEAVRRRRLADPCRPPDAAPTGWLRSPPTLPCDVVINVQGDEPFIDPAAIDLLAAPLVARPRASR